MAKFNPLCKPALTTNNSGHAAYQKGFKLELVQNVLTSFFGEPKFYSDDGNASRMITLATEIAKEDPAFIVKLAQFARIHFNMRSVSHALVAVLAKVHKTPHDHEKKGLVRKAVDGVVYRADDLTEIASAYLKLYGKPFPNSLKRGLGDALNGFNEYALAKYKGDRHQMKMRDLIRLCHPKPKSKESSELFKKCLTGTLETPITWETQLSAKGNSWEVWKDLIDNNKVGYMALLRNLRNIILASKRTEAETKETIDKVIAKISNEGEVRRSKQLPFRFYSAYRELEGLVKVSSKIFRALEEAMEHSLVNLNPLKGTTAIFIDTSGSMETPVSHKSTVPCKDIAVLLGLIAARLSEDYHLWTFNTRLYTNRVPVTENSILGCVKLLNNTTGGTDMALPFYKLIDEEIKVDRIIILSDSEVNCGKSVIQEQVNTYRERVNKNVFVHAIDLQGYGTTQFNLMDKRNCFLAGWSEKVLSFIDLFENGDETLLDKIEQYRPSRPGRC